MLRRTLALLVIAVGVSRTAWGQAVATQLAVTGGSTTDARGIRATTMTAANLSPNDVMDLIPVKPMASLEPTLKQAYAETLGGLHRRLTS